MNDISMDQSTEGKAPLGMATTCCSILPLPFTGRHVPSRPGQGTTKERRDKIVCFGCSLRPNQNRDTLPEKRYPFPLRKPTLFSFFARCNFCIQYVMLFKQIIFHYLFDIIWSTGGQVYLKINNNMIIIYLWSSLAFFFQNDSWKRLMEGKKKKSIYRLVQVQVREFDVGEDRIEDATET